MSMRFRPHPGVVHETIEDEVILIQIDTGLYYSLTGSGAPTWALLHAGHALDDVAGALHAIYDAPPPALRGAVAELAERLAAESLLEAAPPDLPEPAPPAMVNGERREFHPPVLERYDDMQDFLLIDPIHEVDEAAGWPVKKTD